MILGEVHHINSSSVLPKKKYKGTTKHIKIS